MAGCGKKLPPEAPLQVIPARPQPLRVTQEAEYVVLRFPFPARTVQGDTLTRLSRVTVFREVLPAPTNALPAPPPEGAMREREEKLFLLRAEPIRTMGRAELDEASAGSEVVIRDSLYPLHREKRLGKVFLRYGVRVTRDTNRDSELSPLVTLLPRIPPKAPSGLVSTVEEGKVCLEWSPPVEMLDDSKPVVLGGYAIFRRDEKEEAYGAPLGFEPKAETFVDATVQPDRRYVYTVRAAPRKETAPILGPPSEEILVDTRDVFAPPAPEGVLTLSEGSANRLVWNPVLALDLDRYLVYRLEGGTWRKIAEPKDPSHVDVGAPRTARYAVSALDKAGNESARVEGVDR